MGLKFTRFLIRLLLKLLTRVELHGAQYLPDSPCNFVIASNHLGLVDAFLPFYILDNSNSFYWWEKNGKKWGSCAGWGTG